MAKAELAIGALTFVGKPRGSHVHVSILGAGMLGQRPLCGTVVMRADEWESLSKLLGLGVEQDRTIGEMRQRIGTIADEACGIGPVETAEESLTRIERELFVQRQQLADLQQAADEANAARDRMQPVFDAAKSWHVMMRESPSRDGDYSSPDAAIAELIHAVDAAIGERRARGDGFCACGRRLDEEHYHVE